MLGINSRILKSVYKIKFPNVPVGKSHTGKWVPPNQWVTKDGMFINLKYCQLQEGPHGICAPHKHISQ